MTKDVEVLNESTVSARTNTLESRLEKLEKEINLLKGSIKRLLLDIRETLNNLENPFQSLVNSVKSRPARELIQSQATQIVSASAKEEEERERKIEEKKKVEKKDKIPSTKSTEDVKRIEPEKEVIEKEKKEIAGAKPKKSVAIEVIPEVTKLTKYDIITLYELMEWVKEMLEKYDAQSLKTMLDVFEIAGHINGEAKRFIMKLVDLVNVKNGFEDMLLKLYRLYRIIHSSDRSTDFKLLNLLLEKRL